MLTVTGHHKCIVLKYFVFHVKKIVFTSVSSFCSYHGLRYQANDHYF